MVLGTPLYSPSCVLSRGAAGSECDRGILNSERNGKKRATRIKEQKGQLEASEGAGSREK